MADYIYLLENRLSGAQQSALSAVREIARTKGLTLFLAGGAVRDLTSGSPVRDLDMVVQGNALKLKKDLEKAGAQISGEYELMQALFVRFPGNVRMEISSTVSIHYPKPGKPIVKPASILEDLRMRDFTANAMALSLNDGSYGLLMDPLNGVADIENRELRLVNNYGFIEDPIRMVRAARLGARLGWQMEERTQARYETGKAEGYISAMSEFQRGYELEEIVHEEDPLRVLGRLESEGWMKILCASWTTAKANMPELEKLREAQGQLQTQGIHADSSAAQFPLLTAKLAPKDVASLKKSFPRHGFVAEIEALESEARQFAAELSAKQAASPSAAWKLIVSASPEVVLWVAYSTRSGMLQAKFKSFYTEWPSARQRIPYALMQEMRIVPELPGYSELVDRLFFELMDARLGTPEEMKAFLEPHSPPAPPPPVNLRRARAAKAARPAKGKKKAEVVVDGGDSSVAPELAAAALGGSEAADAAGARAEAVAEPAARLSPPMSKAAKTAHTKAVPPAKSAPAKAVATKAKPHKESSKVGMGAAVKLAKTATPAPSKATPAKPAPKPVAKEVVPAKKTSGHARPAARHAVAPAKTAIHAKKAGKPVPKKILVKAPAKSPTKPAGKPGHKSPAKHALKAAAKSAKKKR
ncbi:MAG: hypothetical protein NVSMB62_03190 [Acidobacteriaceae bacterium]